MAEDEPNNDGAFEGAEEECPEHDETIEEVFDHGSLEYFDEDVLKVYMMDDLDITDFVMSDEDAPKKNMPDAAKNQKAPTKETAQPDDETGEVVSDEDQQPDKTSKGTHKDRHSLVHFLTCAHLNGIHALSMHCKHTVRLIDVCSFIDPHFCSCDK